MSILIKDMEMPKNCYVCPFCDYVSARCDAVKGRPYTPKNRYEERADFCPLVPILPHGRLIDADALETDTEYDPHLDGFVSYSNGQIRLAPTIIEAEESE